MVRGKSSKGGMAALFDALMFLAAMSVVSSVLLYSFAAPADDTEQVQEFLERVHAVLLSVTVPDMNGTGKAAPMSEVLMMAAISGTDAPNKVREQVMFLLSSFFLPGTAAIWEVHCSGHVMLFELHTDGHDPAGTRYVSSLASGQLTAELRIWYV